jgi:hypothetical protein
MTEFVLVQGHDAVPGRLGPPRRRTARTRPRAPPRSTLPADKPEWGPADYARHAAAQAGQAGDCPVMVAHSEAGVLLPAIAAAIWLAAYVPDLADGASMLDDIKT